MSPKETIAFQCSSCGNELRATNDFASKRVRCPHCAAAITVPESVPWIRQDLPGTVINVKPPVSRPRSSGINAATSLVLKTWPPCAAALGLFCWLIFADYKSRLMPLLCYPSIVLAGAGITTCLSRTYAWRWTKAAGVLLTICALYLWGRIDTYTEQWINDNVRYTDTFMRWGDQHVYRYIEAYETPEAAVKWSGLRIWTARGPIAGTGKPHGEWNYMYLKPKFKTETMFFWYGEDVSEGEWHMRNKL